MSIQVFRVGLCSVTLAALLGACANNQQAERRVFPAYAFQSSIQSWTVTCPQRTVTITDEKNVDLFYNSNGTVKTLTEFCDENNSASRIPAE